jgi:hypothetical protein
MPRQLVADDRRVLPDGESIADGDGEDRYGGADRSTTIIG